jgi:4-hydroxybenzoyl-CoA reductase subunit beta
MMRLPEFAYHLPRGVKEAATTLAQEGPGATLVAGGTDLYPNMKRRHQNPRVVVSLRRVPELRGIEVGGKGTVRIGAAEPLRALERHAELGSRLPALRQSVLTISTPILRNMGTIGGNLCLDTRCNYYNQTWEWRRAIDFCLKCDGDTCWVAPGSSTCWAVNSSDTVPVMIALGARLHLVSSRRERDVEARNFYRNDGIAYLDKKPDEILTAIEIPPQGSARSTYLKLRRRRAFDFPVMGVAARLAFAGDVVTEACVVINAVGPAPFVVDEATDLLVGKPLTPDLADEVGRLAARPAKPLDNTDFEYAWRKKMVRVYVRRALLSLSSGGERSA